jgi:5-formyltetrahydrofolate cyclo-ligase
MGVMGPPHEADLLEPDILIVPVVAFDDAGHRLGYGKGYYDVTLETLRSRRSILAVGIAYAAQRVPALPHEPHDQKLDWVLTA